MAEKEDQKIWVAVNVIDVRASTNLKGIGKSIGAKYPTLKSKSKKAESFWVSTGKAEKKLNWFITRVSLSKIEKTDAKKNPFWFVNGFRGFKNV